MTLELIIGDKAFSTWSLRPWLVLKRAGADFTEIQILLDQPDTTALIRRHNPTGKVPALKVDGEVIWDSLAICEWAADRWPKARLWPDDGPARWMARSLVAEFHAGYPALRNECSMGPDHPMVGAGGPAPWWKSASFRNGS
jgi:glutathione S-transferase